MTPPDPVEILRRLAGGRVEMVVVGMAAGVLRGAPVTTLDLDIVHQRNPENVRRLLGVLTDLEAGRPKDLAALPVLRATLAETRRRDGQS